MRYPTPHDPARRRCLWGLIALGIGGWLGWQPPVALSSGGNTERLRESMRRLAGKAGVAKLDQWLTLEAKLKQADTSVKLKAINDFFNRHVLWTDDHEINGEKDYWMTPLESLGEGRGDCEDYAIAKYVALRRLGISDSRLRLIYVRANYMGRTTAHMVLGYFDAPDTPPLILDNIIGSILPAAQRRDLFPVFSFNSEGLWAGGSRQSRADPLARLSRWRSVIERMHQQGFD